MSKPHGIGWLNVPGYTPETWNPIVGCSKVSEGCANCYAERMANRLRGMDVEGYERVVNPAGFWNGNTELVESALGKPLKWKKPRAIFVGSMTDLFHKSTPDEWIDQVFAVMALCPQHIFIVLTKRAERMADYMNSKQRRGDASLCRAVDAFPANLGDRHGCLEWPLPNVWMGVTAENHEMADERIPHLLRCPASRRFVSCEPMVGPVELCIPEGCRSCNHPGNVCERSSCTRCGGTGREPSLDWVICGGESGYGARAMDPDWARGLLDQCQAGGVPFFFKQWGEWLHHYQAAEVEVDPADWHESNAAPGFCRVGRKMAGDLLDGRQWHEWPND
jgi:protein gp37